MTPPPSLLGHHITVLRSPNASQLHFHMWYQECVHKKTYFMYCWHHMLHNEIYDSCRGQRACWVTISMVRVASHFGANHAMHVSFLRSEVTLLLHSRFLLELAVQSSGIRMPADKPVSSPDYIPSITSLLCIYYPWLAPTDYNIGSVKNVMYDKQALPVPILSTYVLLIAVCNKNYCTYVPRNCETTVQTWNQRKFELIFPPLIGQMMRTEFEN